MGAVRHFAEVGLVTGNAKSVRWVVLMAQPVTGDGKTGDNVGERERGREGGGRKRTRQEGTVPQNRRRKEREQGRRGRREEEK